MPEPKTTIKLDDELYLHHRSLFDRDTGWYRGFVPLPEHPIPGMCVLFHRTDSSQGPEHLFWIPMDEAYPENAPIRQHKEIKGFWRGTYWNIEAGYQYLETDRWKLVPMSEAPLVEVGTTVYSPLRPTQYRGCVEYKVTACDNLGYYTLEQMWPAEARTLRVHMSAVKATELDRIHESHYTVRGPSGPDMSLFD